MAKPSFMKKALDENSKKREVIFKSLQGEKFGYMGDPNLQWGTGGFIRGGMNLFYGPSKSGKSSVTLLYAGQEQQKKGGIVVLIDTENSYNDPWEVDINGEMSLGAKRMRKRLIAAGIDVDNFLLIQSNQSAEIYKPLTNMEEDLIKDPTCVACVIVDSWESIENTGAAAKIEKGKADEVGNSFGGNAKSINPILKRFIHLNGTYGLTVFSVQHVRANMDPYGPKWLIPGGQTFIHLHNMICMLEGSETKNNSLLEGDVQGSSTDDMAFKVGKLVRFHCTKSRAVVEGRQGEMFINFEELRFARKEESLFGLATRLGIITHPVKDGKENKLWWQYPANAENPIKFQGEKGAVKILTEDQDLYNRIWADCQESKKLKAVTGEISSVALQGDNGQILDLADLK